MFLKDNNNDSLRMVINGGMGDHLLATPFIRHFKKSGKYRHISCAVHRNSQELFDRNPYIDSLIPCAGNDLFIWALPEKGFDVFAPYIDVEDIDNVEDIHNVKTSHVFSFNLGKTTVVRQMCDYYGIALEDEYLEVFTADEDDAWAAGFVEQWAGRKLIYINTFSRMENKDYPLPLWQQVVEGLKSEYGDEAVIIEFPREGKQLDGTYRLPGIPGLRRSAALFKQMDCIVTVDSFPGHLAAALGKPGVVLFGPSNPAAFGHEGNINIRTGECDVCANTSRMRQCKKPKCLEEIPPALIVEKVRESV
ncbi:MAG: glycosyltransferase family 9 protein [bacterium]|nr:glycosyltransferase family 9 protein [bacterium]